MGPSNGPCKQVSQRQDTDADHKPNAGKGYETSLSVKRDLIPEEISGKNVHERKTARPGSNARRGFRTVGTSLLS